MGGGDRPMKRPKSLPPGGRGPLPPGVVLAVFLLAFLAIHRPSITPGQVIRPRKTCWGWSGRRSWPRRRSSPTGSPFSANQDALLLTVYQPLHPLSYSMGWNNAQPLGLLSAPHGSGPSHPLRAPLWDSDAQEILILAFGQTVLEGPARCGSTTTQAFGIIAPTYSLEGALFPPPRETGTSSCTSPPPTEDVFLPAWYQVLDREDRILYTGSSPETWTHASFD